VRNSTNSLAPISGTRPPTLPESIRVLARFRMLRILRWSGAFGIFPAVREDIPENPVRKSGVLNIIELFADG